MPHTTAATTETPRAWCTLVAICLCSPVFAASTVDISCDDKSDPLHEVKVSDISASPAAHSETLAPRVEALIEEAFEEDASETPLEAEDTVEEIAIRDLAETDVPVSLPGVPVDEAERYRRRMHRTDI